MQTNQPHLLDSLLTNNSVNLPHLFQKPHVLVLDHPLVLWRELHAEVRAVVELSSGYAVA